MQPANLRPILHSDHSPIEGCSLFDRNHLLTFRPEPTDAIDSVGLGALVSALKAARHAGGDVRIAAPQFRVSTVLELAQLDRVLMSFESPEQAFDDPT